jgi:hypothetical protein
MTSSRLKGAKATLRPIADLRIIHLVWAPAGLEALRGFLDAVRAHPPGLPAPLTVILNGFDDRAEADGHLALLRGWDADVVWTPEPQYDLGAYAHAAGAASERRLCLMNSYARPLREDWLALLAAPLASGAAAAGATGSWESHGSELRLRDRWRLGGGPRDRLGGLWDWVAYRRRYPRFPNPHLRTNGLVCDRQAILDAIRRSPRTKPETYVMESGRAGLSRRIVAGGGRLVVVDRHGTAHAPDDWPASHTWRAGEQENLLIADNRTEEWGRMSPEDRARAARQVWGRAA